MGARAAVRARGRLCRVELDQRQCILQVGEALLGGHIGTAEKPLAAPFANGCSGVFCKSCEQLHSPQVCGTSRSRA